ncbi:MAG: glycosyl transferase group 1 [Solirubrobacterales bacterium]|nr:glycosyl transferase group 1 [Solirubrobacterales bacterium]
MRALVVSNMLGDPANPARGRFVRDQVSALRRLEDVEVELYEFPPGPRALAAAFGALRRRFARPPGGRLDVVHAHFGLTAWPSLAVPARIRALTMHGTDLADPRTRLATRAVLPLIDLAAAVSPELAERIPGRARARAAVLPCGVDTTRFRPLPRREARGELGLSADVPLLLFPADPARPEKRYDRAAAVAERAGAELIALKGVAPERVPLFVNAADAVLVPSEREGFGLAVLEALACDVPVLATPVGIHAAATAGVEGTLCAPFELARWAAALAPHLHADDPRVAGRAAAERWSAAAMAEQVRDAWSQALNRSR